MEKAPGLPPCERGVQARSLFCVYGKRVRRSFCRRNDGGEHFRGPERVPDAHRAKLSAEHPGQRHDEDDVAAQGDHQRLRALAQTLQRAGRGGGDGGDHKAQADDPQSNFSGFHRLRGRGKEPHERLRGCQTAKGARCHDGGAQDEGDLVEPAYPFMLPGTVVVADEGTHSLHDAVGGQVEECL